jgi:hypothetical protein
VPYLHRLYERLISPEADSPDPHYGAPINRSAMRRAGDKLPDDASVFVYTSDDPTLSFNVHAGVRLFFTPAAVAAEPSGADWVFSYTAPSLLPAGVRAGRVVRLGDRIFLVQVRRR